MPDLEAAIRRALEDARKRNLLDDDWTVDALTGELTAALRPLLTERATVAEEIALALEARAQRIRETAFNESTGIALAAIVQEDAALARQHATT